MSTFKVSKDQQSEESLVLNKKSGDVKARIAVWTVKDGDYIVSLVPSLRLSGYGDNKDASIEMLKEALNDYFDNLFALGKDMDQSLSELGWHKRKYYNKKYEGPYIDEKGFLKDFELPEDTEIEKEVLEVAA